MARTTLIMTIALAASMLVCDATAQTATAANASVKALPKAKPMSSSMVEMQEYATGRVKEIRTEEFFQSK